jgi:hypothetical protein
MLVGVRDTVCGVTIVMAAFLAVGLSDYVVWFAFISSNALPHIDWPWWLHPPLWFSRFSYLSGFAEGLLGFAVVIWLVALGVRRAAKSIAAGHDSHEQL